MDIGEKTPWVIFNLAHGEALASIKTIGNDSSFERCLEATYRIATCAIPNLHLKITLDKANLNEGDDEGKQLLRR